MRAVLLSFISAMILGVAGAYGWSVLHAPTPHPAHLPKAAFAPIPPSPDELPAEQDQEWAARAEQGGAPLAANEASAAPPANQAAATDPSNSSVK